MKRILTLCLAIGFLQSFATAVFAIDVKAAVLRIDYPRLLPISRYDTPQPDIGFAGAMLADEDNGTTGGFLGHKYETQAVSVAPEQADSALQDLLGAGIRLFVIIAQGDDLLRLADMAAQSGALVFNVASGETRLRDDACRANILHIAPSHAMLADAVGQFAIWKKWSKWLVVSGSNVMDTAIADAFRNTARKFGATIVQEKVFVDTGGSRRTDSGHVLVQRQLPVFMQDAKDHDVVIAADGTDYFARYLPFHQWSPRPVMGSAGLIPTVMHGAHEAWGAAQFQNRFERLTNRHIQPEDYNTWLALRVIGEAVTRASTAEPMGVRDYAMSDQFELAAFKGQKVTFRKWNGQLRQPILLKDGFITVSVSPQDGFLHQRSPLDTLGLDQPESRCAAFD